MHTKMLLGTCALFSTAACGAGDVGLDTVDPLAVHLHELSATPGCYVESVPPNPDAADSGNAMAEQTLEMQEMNLSLNLQYVSLLTRVVLEDPYADRWQLRYTQGELNTVVDIRAESKQEQYTALVFESLTEGWTQVTITEKGWVSRATTSYIVADAHASNLETSSARFRWNDHAVEATLPAVVTQPGWSEPSSEVVTLLWGCDPRFDVSFSQSLTEPLHCWRNDDRAAVTCAGVALWP